VQQFEIAVLNNLNIESPDEALSLVPTLKVHLTYNVCSLWLMMERVSQGKLEPEQLIQLLDDLKRYQTNT
jgi:hypothetical protein